MVLVAVSLALAGHFIIMFLYCQFGKINIYLSIYLSTAQIKHIWFGRKKEIDDILMEVISENRNVKKSESSNSTEHSCGRPAKDCDSKDNKSDSDSEFEAVSVSYWRVVD